MMSELIHGQAYESTDEFTIGLDMIHDAIDQRGTGTTGS